MSSIYLEIGQCGCQIGRLLNDKLSESYYSTRIHGKQKEKKVHAIMLDTQPKVLRPILDSPPYWMDPANIKYFEHGRGNNWSYGFMHQLPGFNEKENGIQQIEIDFDPAHRQKNKGKIEQFVQGHKQFSHLDHFSQKQQKIQPINESPKKEEEKKNKLTVFEEKVLLNKYIKENREISDYALDRVRKQLDHTDCPLCINIICSLGGGTGSGLGTKLIQKIYDQFSIDTFAHVVLPNKSGQTPLQIYNCALSLASIQEHSTAIFTYENDNMIKMFLESKKQKSEGSQKISNDLDVINKEIAKMQARLFMLNDIQGFPQFYNSLVSDCILSNQLKYIQLFGSSVKPSETFADGFDTLCNQLRLYNEDTYQIEGLQTERGKNLASSMVICSNISGIQKKTESVWQQHHNKKLKTITNAQLDKSLHLVFEFNEKSKNKNKNLHEILFIMNHSNVTRYLQYLSVSGRKKMEAKAYLWHYKYADLSEAFNRIETVVDQYNFCKSI